MGFEEHLPGGVLLSSVEKLAGWPRSSSVWPAPARPGVIRHGEVRIDIAGADLLIVSGRVSQKMVPILRQVYDQMPDPKWVISMGVCASSGGMFNNDAVVQGVDHIIPVDIYLPGCLPRPEMLHRARAGASAVQTTARPRALERLLRWPRETHRCGGTARQARSTALPG